MTFDTFMTIICIIVGIICFILVLDKLDKLTEPLYQKYLSGNGYPWKAVLGLTASMFLIAWIYGLFI